MVGSTSAKPTASTAGICARRKLAAAAADQPPIKPEQHQINVTSSRIACLRLIVCSLTICLAIVAPVAADEPIVEPEVNLPQPFVETIDDRRVIDLTLPGFFGDAKGAADDGALEMRLFFDGDTSDSVYAIHADRTPVLLEKNARHGTPLLRYAARNLPFIAVGKLQRDGDRITGEVSVRDHHRGRHVTGALKLDLTDRRRAGHRLERVAFACSASAPLPSRDSPSDTYPSAARRRVCSPPSGRGWGRESGFTASHHWQRSLPSPLPRGGGSDFSALPPMHRGAVALIEKSVGW